MHEFSVDSKRSARKFPFHTYTKAYVCMCFYILYSKKKRARLRSQLIAHSLPQKRGVSKCIVFISQGMHLMAKFSH